MYDIKWIRENAALFDKGRARRGLEPLSLYLIAKDDARKAAISVTAMKFKPFSLPGALSCHVGP
jgi:hypothetical protein